jgi:ABC-type antimicrobial peptide transport system permease subunit
MDDLLADGLVQPRLYSTLVGAFAACALIIVGVGVFAVLSYTVSLRRREIGVRVALGARPVDVVRLVTGRGLALACAGLVAGLAVSLAGGRILERFLYGVRSHDAVGVLSVAVALAFVALLASALPAHRAARIDPGRTLRDN